MVFKTVGGGGGGGGGGGMGGYYLLICRRSWSFFRVVLFIAFHIEDVSQLSLTNWLK